MKTFAWHVLILGGFYFIVSLLSSFPQGAGADSGLCDGAGAIRRNGQKNSIFSNIKRHDLMQANGMRSCRFL